MIKESQVWFSEHLLMFSLHQKIPTMTKASIHRSTKEQKCKIKDH